MESVTAEPPDRRARARRRTIADIKGAARALLAEHGPAGISLRAIGRSLGMTAPAIYRYYGSLDALVVSLTADLYGELRDHMEAAYEPIPPDRLIDRLLAAARGFRSWAVAHRPEFTLMFASLAPGAIMSRPEGTDCVVDVDAEPYASMVRFSSVFGTMLDEVYHQADSERGFAITAQTAPPMSDSLTAELRRCTTAIGMRVPDDVAFTLHSYWVKLYGLVAMEVFGQLPIVAYAEELFEAELYTMIVQLGGKATLDGRTAAG